MRYNNYLYTNSLGTCNYGLALLLALLHVLLKGGSNLNRLAWILVVNRLGVAGMVLSTHGPTQILGFFPFCSLSSKGRGTGEGRSGAEGRCSGEEGYNNDQLGLFTMIKKAEDNESWSREKAYRYTHVWGCPCIRNLRETWFELRLK